MAEFRLDWKGDEELRKAREKARQIGEERAKEKGYDKVIHVDDDGVNVEEHQLRSAPPEADNGQNGAN